MEEVKTKKRFSLLTDDYNIPEEEKKNIGKPELTKREIKQQEKAAKLEQKKEDKAHNGTLNEKREEKEQKEKDGNDSFEEGKKVVMDGAKLMCPFAVGEGKLVVSSNEITIQDQLWATEGDKNNMLNLQFEGICNHPNFAAYPVKPQCKSVIFLDKWTGVGTTKVQDQTVLIKDACIGCDPKPNVAVPQAPAATTKKSKSQEEEEEENYEGVLVLDAYWVDKDNQKTQLYPYQSKAHIKINFHKEAIDKKYRILVYDDDPGFDNSIIESKWLTVKDTGTIVSFTIDGEDFNKGDEADVIELYFEVEVKDDKEYEFCNSDKEYLKVHAVIYVPEIEGALGWSNAKKAQEIWFKGKSNSTPWSVKPELNFVSMDWVLGYPRMLAKYNEVKTLWKTDNAITLLKKRIKEMVDHGRLRLPTNDLGSVSFGIDSDELETFPNMEQPKIGNAKKSEKMPLFERYYHQSVSYMISKVPPETLDDVFGTLASCQFRIIAFGKITKKKGGYFGINNDASYKIKTYYDITINKIGIYIKDSFDFISEDEYLGDWSPTKKEVAINPYFPAADGYYSISNKSYRDYRKTHKKGQDFHLYTNIKYTTVSHTFKVSRDEINNSKKGGAI